MDLNQGVSMTFHTHVPRCAPQKFGLPVLEILLIDVVIFILFNIRCFLQIGIFGVGLTTLLCPLAKDFTSLMINFIVLGLVDGLSCASFNILVLGSARKGQYGKVIGFAMAVQSIGLISGPPSGG